LHVAISLLLLGQHISLSTMVPSNFTVGNVRLLHTRDYKRSLESDNDSYILGHAVILGVLYFLVENVSFGLMTLCVCLSYHINSRVS